MIFGSTPLNIASINTSYRGVILPVTGVFVASWDVSELTDITYTVNWDSIESVTVGLGVGWTVQEVVHVACNINWTVTEYVSIDFSTIWRTNYYNNLNHNSTYCVPRMNRNFVYRCNQPTKCECEEEIK